MAIEKQMPIVTQDPFSWRDMNSLRFAAQFFFSTVILSFCLIQLHRTDIENKNTALYWSCLSGILALWMPSPAASRGTSSYSMTSEPDDRQDHPSSLIYPYPEVVDESRLRQ
ncbi:MAG: hypothetical protein WCD18_16210 [Thermosynechococcaceae cyanobacterium]